MRDDSDRAGPNASPRGLDLLLKILVEGSVEGHKLWIKSRFLHLRIVLRR